MRNGEVCGLTKALMRTAVGFLTYHQYHNYHLPQKDKCRKRSAKLNSWSMHAFATALNNNLFIT